MSCRNSCAARRCDRDVKMPINHPKVVEILLEEVDATSERGDGYRSELKEAIAEIMMAERSHREQRQNIQQQVDDLCERAGVWLSGNPEWEEEISA